MDVLGGIVDRWIAANQARRSRGGASLDDEVPNGEDIGTKIEEATHSIFGTGHDRFVGGVERGVHNHRDAS